ncbi:hypothetical protein [Massilia sp.]|uniref:hypothetical protein n=1 Tax=Massilia sp. TaxID=1882437 RepID=UPI0039192C96
MQNDTRSADLQAYYDAMWTRAMAWPWSPVPVRPARRASMRCSSVWRLPARAISPRS